MYHQKAMDLIVYMVFMLTWSNIERNTVATVKSGIALSVLLVLVCWWLLLSVSFDINRPPFSVYSYPWKMWSLSEINSVECSSSHSCDSKSWIYLILFLEKFNLFASCYFFCCFCGGGGNRPLINLMNMWLWNLYENEWNMKSNPTKRIQPAALSQNKT